MTGLWREVMPTLRPCPGMLVVFDVQCGGVEDLNQLRHHVAVGHVGIEAVVTIHWTG